MGKTLTRHKLYKDIIKDYQIYLLMLPALIYFAIFCYYPMPGRADSVQRVQGNRRHLGQLVGRVGAI